MGFWGGVREVMRSLLLFLLLAALTRCSPVSEAAAEPDPQPQPVADPDADAHYGHWGYGRAIVLPTLWGASYGHHLHHHKRAAEPEPHHGYNRYGFRGYRGWYGKRKRAADALPEPVAGPMPLLWLRLGLLLGMSVEPGKISMTTPVEHLVHPLEKAITNIKIICIKEGLKNCFVFL